MDNKFDRWLLDWENCGDCGVNKGELHEVGCDLEECPCRDKRQLITCKCRYYPHDDWHFEEEYQIFSPDNAIRIPFTGNPWLQSNRQAIAEGKFLRRNPDGVGWISCHGDAEGAKPDSCYIEEKLRVACKHKPQLQQIIKFENSEIRVGIFFLKNNTQFLLVQNKFEPNHFEIPNFTMPQDTSFDKAIIDFCARKYNLTKVDSMFFVHTICKQIVDKNVYQYNFAIDLNDEIKLHLGDIWFHLHEEKDSKTVEISEAQKNSFAMLSLTLFSR